MKRTNRQGSVVGNNSGRVSNAPSGAGRANRICALEPEGAAEAAVIPRTTPWGAVTSPHQHYHIRKTAERVPAAVGKASQRLRPTRQPTPHPRRQIAGRELPSRYFPGGTDATWSGCCCCFLTLTDPLRIQPWSQDRRSQTKSNRESEISMESRQKRTDKEVSSKGHRRDKIDTNSRNKLEPTA